MKAGIDGCDTCKLGYTLNLDSGKCQSCNSGIGIDKCLECSTAEGDSEPTCSKCDLGFRLEGGKCVACSVSKFCAVCGEA
jgi:hypothetical protein